MTRKHDDVNASRQFHLPAKPTRVQETYENETNGIHVVLSAAKRLCIVKTHIYIFFFFQWDESFRTGPSALTALRSVHGAALAGFCVDSRD